MNTKRNFIIILAFILGLTVCIQVTRLNTFLTTKANTTLLNPAYEEANEINEKNRVDEQEKYLIVYDKKSSYFEAITANLCKTLDYMKIPYETVPVQEFREMKIAYDHMVFVLEDINLIQNLSGVWDRIYNGGQVFFAYRLEPSPKLSSISTKLGIVETGNFVDTEGIQLVDNLLLGGKDMAIKEASFLNNSSVTLQLSTDVTLHAKSADGVNLLWSKNYGKGKVFYFNGSMLGEKIHRGLISGIISAMGEDTIYPIMNAKINFIDDFPSPAPTGINEVIDEEYNKTIAEFYKEVWWPDILRIGAVNGLKYTGVAIGTYDDEIKNLKDSEILITSRDIQGYVKDLLASGGEIGIHGYNHQPLTTKPVIDEKLGYLPWDSYEVMVEGIKAMRTFINYFLQEYAITTYVPPSNIITEEGIDALREGDSDLKIVASLYETGTDEDAYEQELEIDERGVIHLPRLISGYSYTDEMKWLILSGVNMHGYFSHFAHPDDILDPHRSKDKTWSTLLKEFSEMQRNVSKKYPWLEGATATEGANQLIKYLEADLSYQKSDEELVIHNSHFRGDLSFFLRTDKTIKRVINGSMQRLEDNFYLITTTDAKSTILFER